MKIRRNGKIIFSDQTDLDKYVTTRLAVNNFIEVMTNLEKYPDLYQIFREEHKEDFEKLRTKFEKYL